MKICFLSGDIHSSGGTERVGSIIINSLANRDNYQLLLLSFWNHGEPFFPLDKKVELCYLLDPKTEGKLYRTYIYPLLKLHRFIKNNNIDIIIDIDTVLACYTSYAIRGTKCKQISWEHFNYWTMQERKEKKRFNAKKLLNKYASKLVVLTEEDRQKHLKEYGLDPDFVVTMPNPCMSNINVNYNFDSKTFLAVGRLTSQKNFEALLDAWSLIQHKCKDWKVVIVGKGDLEASLKAHAKELRLNNLIFAGHTNHVEDYYGSASCFVLSSVYEGFPMVILEAQSFGLPVISFDCKTGPRDLVHEGMNGYLVEAGNVEILAGRMYQFTNSREKAKKMSVQAARGVQQYDLKSITDQWCKLLDEVYRNELPRGKYMYEDSKN